MEVPMSFGDAFVGGGGLEGFAARIPINLPATMSIETILSVLGSTDGASAITEDRIRAPDEALLLHIYNVLLTIPSLRETIALHETERKENERRNVDMESQLHEAERLKAEAEARAEEDRRTKEEALKSKVETDAHLAQVQGTLAALQSSADSGVQQSAEVKGRLDQAEQEKRGVLEMLEREKIESARRAEEIETLTTRSRESRVEVNRLSTELQISKSAEGSAKFKIQSLEQELSLKTNDAAWAHQELTKATEELAQYLSRMNGEISSLSVQLQQTSQALEASESKTSAIQSAYDSTLVRMDETMREKAELRQRLVEQEGAFKSEMGTQQRLSALMEQQKDNAEQRLADIEEQWERVLAQHNDREEALRHELNTHQERYDELAREKEEIQKALDHLAESVGIDTNGYQVGAADENDAASMISVAATPRRSALQISGSPAIMSPTAALASKVQKSGKSFTQIYAELAKSEEELRRERMENRRLVSVLEQVMADLHDRAPALQAQREEKEQLEQHAEELSTALANACQERDYSEHEAKQQRLRADATQQENILLNQQVTDLARQVRDLTREIIIRDDPATAERLEADGTRLGDSTTATIATVSDTQNVISEQLVTFRSLTELITQNSRLLRVVRQLGSEMEAREKTYRSDYEEQESDAVEEAKAVITRLQEDLRAERTRAEGVRRERDMFRAMTAQGGGNRSVSGTFQSSSGANVESSNAAHVTLTNQYSQLQAQFEAFRSETANDMERLKEEAYQARSEANKSALVAAKEKASRESVEERLSNTQQTYNLERKELQDLQKRHNSVQESLAKQEISVQSMSQQLVMAQGNVDRLRNEVSNLKAEKQLHKETTDRLMEEKKASVQERINLSELLRSAQTMQADLERSSAEVRRRLEGQVEKLEEQCKELRDRATKEEEAHRQTTLRREIETTELRTKLDRAMEDLAKVREELAVAKNSVQHLTSRTEDLQKQVDSKDEKLAVYERRNNSTSGTNVAGSTNMSTEQQLQVEIADLKGELRSAQIDAEQAKTHTEQFKSIATANEEALAQLQTSYDQYKATTDASIAQKDLDLTNLRERNEALATELTTAQNEASTERQERERQGETFRAEKKVLEDALSEVTAVEDRARVTREGMHGEVQRQIQLTQEAHAKYEAELLAHAEDVKALASVKEQLDTIRTQLLEAQKSKETAEGNLAGSTDSWTRQKELLEREKDELKKASQEMKGQNEALHKHLESLQAQMKVIRQSSVAGGAAEGGEQQATNVGDLSMMSQSDNEELHEVIRYLRREKEIVDLQVEIREQECARLRQSIEHTQRSLDETRMQLSQEREQNAGASASAKQHEELMEKINQLSILRESNATLRDESERAQRKVQTLEAKVENLTKELEPIREEVRVKTVELEACQNQLRLSQEDNKRWQGRTQSILQQYNRIDPDELKRLQEQKDTAEKALEEQKAELEERTKELAAVKEEVTKGQDRFERLRQQSIERIRSLNEKLNEFKTQLDAKEAQGTEAEAQNAELIAIQSELESIRAEKQELEGRITALESEKAALESQVAENVNNNQPNTESSAGIMQGENTDAINEEAKNSWDAERTQMEEKYKALEQREQKHLQRAKEFLTQLKSAQKERDELQAQKHLWQTNSGTAGEVKQENGGAAEPSVELETLQARIVELEKELERANQRIAELEANGPNTPDIEQLKREHDQALREQEGRLSLQYTEQQKQAVQIAVQKARSAAAGAGQESVEEQVQERLKAFEDQRQNELQMAIQAKEQELRSHYDDLLKARYEAGKEEVTLRNKLLIKTKDSKIEKLTTELNALKGISVTPAATAGETNGGGIVPSAPGNAASALPNRPAMPQMRGGAAPRPVARPVPTGPMIARGGAPVRGTGRGGLQAAGAQKRKLDTADGGNAGAGNAAQAGNVEGNKKPRAAGGPIAIRGGAGGQRGGAANRGGRGGAPQ